MRPHSQRIIHLGINFITIPSPVVTKMQSLAFQQAVIANGLDFTKVENPERRVTLIREIPPHSGYLSVVRTSLGRCC